MKRETVWPADVPWVQELGSSPAVRAGGWVFTSNHLATDYVSDAPTIDPREPAGRSAIEIESRLVLEALGRTLAAAGADLRTDTARIHWWLRADRPTLHDIEAGSHWTGIEDLTPIHEARHEVIDDPEPASTGIGIRQLLVPEAALATALLAAHPAARRERHLVEPPASLRIPDSAAVRIGDWVFTVGVIASDWRGDAVSFVDPRARVSPHVWFGSDVEAQVESVLETLAAVATAAGTTLDRCVHADVFYGHPRDLYAVERAWRRAFPARAPARTLVPYAGLAGAGCRVEIALTLLAGEAPIERVETSAAPEPPWHEPQAVKAGGLVFISTLTAAGDDGRIDVAPFPHLRDAGRDQAQRIVERTAAICEAAGTSLANVCRRATYYADLADFPACAAAWAEQFAPADVPAAIDVGLGPGRPMPIPGARMLTDAVAVTPR
jgi:enamine deaminase RidA (YjgF/YER057c/UK114 family)